MEDFRLRHLTGVLRGGIHLLTNSTNGFENLGIAAGLREWRYGDQGAVDDVAE
ncbi:hypothetical protein NEUTE2DRAFT_68533 [Neurospora tetrasperma FGSC 2509]|nr:hypothetical protein NEUTE2DRAFT_68533 [Neurospora tetrasperma FGSC 2509]